MEHPLDWRWLCGNCGDWPRGGFDATAGTRVLLTTASFACALDIVEPPCRCREGHLADPENYTGIDQGPVKAWKARLVLKSAHRWRPERSF